MVMMDRRQCNRRSNIVEKGVMGVLDSSVKQQTADVGRGARGSLEWRDALQAGDDGMLIEAEGTTRGFGKPERCRMMWKEQEGEDDDDG